MGQQGINTRLDLADAKAIQAQKTRIKREAVIRGLRLGVPSHELRRSAKASREFIQQVAAEIGVEMPKRSHWRRSDP